MEPLRVLHIIDGLAGGGSERLLCDIVRLSDPQRVTHHIFTTMPDPGDGSFVYASTLQEAGIYEKYKPKTRAAWKNLLRPLWHRVIAMARRNRYVLRNMEHKASEATKQRIVNACQEFRPDIIHGHCMSGTLPGAIAKEATGQPLVYLVPCSRTQLPSHGQEWVWQWLCEHHETIDHYQTVYVEELTEIGVPTSKISLWDGFVDFAPVEATLKKKDHHSRQVRQQLGISDNAPIMITVGRLHPSKGHEYAIEAMALLQKTLPELHLVVLGEGEELPNLHELARRLNIENRVHFAGFQADALPFYAAANLYLRTPIYEAENVSSYWAMAMALPVVGFDTGLPSEKLRIYKHGIIVPNRDAKALAQGVQEILNSSDAGHAMGQAGQENCRRFHSLQSAVEETVTLYEKLCRQ